MTEKLIEAESARVARVLLAEDNDTDVEITKRACQKARLAVDLYRVENGEECLRFLRKEGNYVDAPTPDLLLLDLNMPLKSGLEVLEEISTDAKLRHLPVVVLTTSDDDRDVLKSYELRCSSYVTKPVDFSQFQRIVSELGSYWFSLVVLPSKHSED